MINRFLRLCAKAARISVRDMGILLVYSATVFTLLALHVLVTIELAARDIDVPTIVQVIIIGCCILLPRFYLDRVTRKTKEPPEK